MDSFIQSAKGFNTKNLDVKEIFNLNELIVKKILIKNPHNTVILNKIETDILIETNEKLL